MGPATAADRQLHFHGALSGLVREVEHFGRPHLVAPVVLVKEMVLESDGRNELLPAEEIERTAERNLWDGRPVTIDHPVHNGRFVSAGKLEAAESSEIGTLRNVEAVEEGGETKLKGEAWIDVGKAERLERGRDILEALRAFTSSEVPAGARPLEVSTGYWATLDESESGHFRGQRYSGAQRGIFPDHLATLPDAVGKCSLDDGCGMPRLNARGTALLPATVVPHAAMLADEEDWDGPRERIRTNVLAQARRPEFSDGSGGEWSPPSLSDFISVRGWDAETWEDLTEDQRQEVVATTLLGDVQDTFGASMVFPVADENGLLFEGALDAVLSGRGAQADVPSNALESARGMARTLLEEEFDRDLEENEDRPSTRRQVLAGLAKLLGQEIEFIDAQSDDDLRERLQLEVEERFGGEDAHVWIEDVFSDDGFLVYERREGGGDSGLFRVDFEVDDGGAVALGEPVEVSKRTEYEPVGNVDPGASPEDNSEDEESTMIELNESQRTAIVAALIACEACEYEESTLEALTDGDLVAVARAREVEPEGLDLNELGGGEPAAEDVSGGGGSEEGAGEEDGDEDSPEANVSLDEVEEVPLEKLPASIRALVEERQEEREEKIERLASNDACPFTEADLESASDEALDRYLASLEDDGRGGTSRTRRTYAARGGPRSGSSGGDEGEGYFERHPRTPAVVTRNVRKEKRDADEA